MDMDLEWCLSCASCLPKHPVQHAYCSIACHRSATLTASTSATPIDAHSVYTASDESEELHDVHYASQWPGTSSSGIRAWRRTVAHARPESPVAERATSPSRASAFGLSTHGFVRPELMRRHTPNQPTPPSVFVDKARHAFGKPTSLATPIATSPPRTTHPSSTRASVNSSSVSYITESAVATPASATKPTRPPGGLLHRVKSWVHLEVPSRAPSPASSKAAEFVALPGMDSTATLVGESAPAKQAVVALVEEDDLPELAPARVSRSPPGLARAEFRAPRASRLALDAHPAYNTRGRVRTQPREPPLLFSQFGYAL